jgi:acyl-CoA thioester hydrolase
MPAHVFAPKEGAYVHTFTVEARDIDALGHANNVSFIRWINDAAIAHSTSVGFGIEACLRAGLVWVVRRHDVEYLRPAFAGERIEALTWPESLSAATSLRRTLFRRVEAGGQDSEAGGSAGAEGTQILARSETTWALFDPETQRPRRVPEAMRAAYGFVAGPL